MVDSGCVVSHERSDFELMLGAAMRRGEVRFKRVGTARVRCTLLLASSTLRSEQSIEREDEHARPALRQVLEALSPVTP
jgi:hypothetical protein